MPDPSTHLRDSGSRRWHGEAIDLVSLAWEGHTGCDSIPTIERLYDRSASGAYLCPFPACGFARKDATAMWRHVHSGHGSNVLPPDDFDPGPWL